MLLSKPATHALIFCAITIFPVSAQDRREIKRPLSIRTFTFQTSLPSEDEEGTLAESQSARVYKTAIHNLFYQENFARLEEIADAARTEKSRFRGGGWKLKTYYGVIGSPGSMTSTDADWNAHMERLKRWIAFRTDSSTPRVALAGAYLGFAWKARGNGMADTVTAEGWKLFGERVQKAKDTLVQARSFSTQDPHWYHVMQTVALAQDWDKKQAEQLLEQAYTVEPAYYYFYDSYANYLLPKWDGKPGDTEAFAETMADRVGGQEGDFIYFHVAFILNCCKAHAQAPAISWDRVKQGFAALEQLYGSTNYQRNALAYMAVREGDKEFAQQLFARIGDNWDGRVWRSKVKFDRSKASLSLSN